MNAARVIADHAAERVTAVSRGVRAKGQVVLSGSVAQLIEHDAGFDARITLLRVHLDNPVHVLREIEQEGEFYGLAGNPGASPASHDRRAMAAAHFESVQHIGGIS